jgi:membrane-bound lytic murein transglycosylase A
MPHILRRLTASLIIKRLLAPAILGTLVACSTPLPPVAPVPRPADPNVVPTNPFPVPMVNATIVRAKARWVPVDWAELPGFEADRSSELWPALLRGCERPAFDWAALCEQARAATTPAFSDDATRTWLRQRLQPYRVESLDSAPEGLMTGYFEPLVDAVRKPRGAFRVPLYGPPADLATR